MNCDWKFIIFKLLLLIKFTTSLKAIESLKSIEVFTKIDIGCQAISQITNRLHNMHSTKFNLMIHCDNRFEMKFASKLLNISSAPIHLICIQKSYKFDFGTSLITIGKFSEQVEFIPDLRPKYRSFSHFVHLIYDFVETQSENSTLEEEMNYDRTSYVTHSTNTDQLFLFGNEFYQTSDCLVSKKVINVFSVSSMTWQLETFIPIYSDYHNCEIVIYPMVIQFLSHSYADKFKVRQYANILDIFVKHYNLSYFVANGSVKGFPDIVMPARFNNSAVKMYNIMHVTPSVYYFTSRLLVSLDSPRTLLQKLEMPFDSITWQIIIASFVLSYLTIFVVNFLPAVVQKFVYGTRVTTPCLNVFQIVMGLSLSRIPGRNFARFILTLFTIYCLIIRTSYQGKLFEFLNDEITKPTANNLNEVLEKKMDIHYDSLYTGK